METREVPINTIQVFARSIHEEAARYGFSQIDMVRLINELMDLTTTDPSGAAAGSSSDAETGRFYVDDLPLQSRRLEIRLADPEDDLELLGHWIQDEYGKHFLLSCLTAQEVDLDHLLHHSANRIGIIRLEDRPIGAVAFLDIDPEQKRAELRKLIGERWARGQGFAEEATRLWIRYGSEQLGLEKIYVSTLQTHLRNIQLNESIGFKVEGLLHNEVLIGERRFDVLRMGLDCSGTS